MKRLKQLEDENGKLRKLVADLSLEKETLQDVIHRKLRGLVANASWWRIPVLSGKCRSGESRRRDQAGIEARIKDFCATRVRYGYRRVHVMLTREGWDINMKRLFCHPRRPAKLTRRIIRLQRFTADPIAEPLRQHPWHPKFTKESAAKTVGKRTGRANRPAPAQAILQQQRVAPTTGRSVRHLTVGEASGPDQMVRSPDANISRN